jgi:hypothetical protein
MTEDRATAGRVAPEALKPYVWGRRGGTDEILEVRREIFREVLARAAVCKRWG